ncbi:MAG: M20 family metallopeptidase [Eubacteriales bacterium]|nr:M20 family metallopeptidase [Eubacteriales bacterium]
MSSLNELKTRVCDLIDSHKAEILEVSHKIHENPELGLEEFFACGLLCEKLEENGFSVRKGLAGLETSFRGDYFSGKEGPRIAIIAEYDALKNLGHGCGHNIIAAAAIGSAIALKEVMSETGGSLAVMGAPAEETMGGKINLLDAGEFDDCDYAMMIHPCPGEGIVGRGGLACCELTFEYFGRQAHSATEHLGINALTALINTFNNIALIRETFKPGQKLNGIILSGGDASNIVPGYAKSTFCVRANTLTELKELNERVIRCAEAAAAGVGATVKYETGPLFAERYSNRVMDECYLENMKAIGVPLHFPKPGEMVGSSDIGNVSLKMPTVHEYTSITPEHIAEHTVEFRNAAVSTLGDEGCINGTKGLAMLALDILCNEALREKINKEFEETVK